MSATVVLVVFFGGLVVELGVIVVLGRTATRPWEKRNAVRAPAGGPRHRLGARPERVGAGLHRARGPDDPLLTADAARAPSLAGRTAGRHTGGPAGR